MIRSLSITRSVHYYSSSGFDRVDFSGACSPVESKELYDLFYGLWGAFQFECNNVVVGGFNSSLSFNVIASDCNANVSKFLNVCGIGPTTSHHIIHNTLNNIDAYYVMANEAHYNELKEQFAASTFTEYVHTTDGKIVIAAIQWHPTDLLQYQLETA